MLPRAWLFAWLLVPTMALARPTVDPEPDPSPPCLHFCRGGVDLGLAFGGGSSNGRFMFSIGANVGYYVLDGFVLGASTVYQSKPSQYVLPEAYARWYPFTRWSTTPFLLAKFGRLFGLESGWPDANIGTVGGGVATFFTERLAFQLYVAYQFVMNDAYADGFDFGGGLAFTL
jgi:hypothetical protein